MDFNCLPTAIGSMPHTDPVKACDLATRYLKDIPAWCQLPARDYRENMYVQYSEGFPGVVIADGNIRVKRSPDADKALESLYAAYLENNVERFPVSPDYAAGLYEFLSRTELAPRAVKGQVTGPVTWGLTVTDDTGKAVIYDDILGDAVPRLLRLKAGWMEKKLREMCRNTIIFVDEPSMSTYGSVAMNLSREKIVSLLDEVLGGIDGLKGVHCCGNTDWSVLLGTSADIISFDSYNYAQSLSLYPAEVKKFVDGGGTVAWGCVPNEEAALAIESVASLKDRVEEAMAPFTRKGIPFRKLLAQGLLTPCCGLASLSAESSEQALGLLSDLSKELRSKYL